MDEFEDELGLSREELDAWAVPSPPEGFSHAVMRAHDARDRDALPAARRTSRRWVFAMVASIAMAMAGAWLWSALESEGSLHADARTTREVGPMVLVAEPGASLDWSVGRRGGRVHQAEGDVFYRVDGPTDLKVETPAGRIDVQGTCFRVQITDAEMEIEENEMRRTTVASATLGIALGALVTVTVYEGRVAFANESGEVVAEAGEEIVARDSEAPRSRAAEPGEDEASGDSHARGTISPSLLPADTRPAALERLSPSELRRTCRGDARAGRGPSCRDPASSWTDRRGRGTAQATVVPPNAETSRGTRRRVQHRTRSTARLGYRAWGGRFGARRVGAPGG